MKNNKIINFEQLVKIRQKFKKSKVILCHGTFDFLHYGHFLHFKKAKEFGDILVVSVTSDKFVNKGPNRPFYKQDQRLNQISFNEFVDFVCLSDYQTGIEVINALKPDIYVKGKDYKNNSLDKTKGIFKEITALKKNKGEIHYTAEETFSSTRILNDYSSTISNENKDYIRQIKKKITLDQIHDAIDELKNIKVTILGEPIVDSYINCNPIGISSKNPSIAVKKTSTIDYAGGSMAIANNLIKLGCKVTLITINGNEKYYKNTKKNKLHKKVHHIEIFDEDIITPRKTRYFSNVANQKIFEVVELNHDYKDKSRLKLEKKINENIKKNNILMIADFGHGLFEKSTLALLKKIKKFKCLNVQSNSENYGFNTFDKYNNFYDYLCIDEKEARYGFKDRYSSVELLIKKMNKKSDVSITLGTNGSLFKRKGKNFIKTPVFFDNVKDTLGSGDAYFSITSLLNYLNKDQYLISFLGNVYAGLSTQIIANSESIDVSKLHKTVESIFNISD
tara:strand:+ start:6543 stop:8060 length:1518 start_codon:yes stop_codon:yes gene_type:complete